jgi:predicted metal-dependent peptidase
MSEPSSGSDEQGGGADTDYPGNLGAVQDATDENGTRASEAEIRRQQHEWNIAAEQALRSAKSCGREPLAIERQLLEARQSKQDWRSALREFMAARDPADYRWTPPNRRHVYVGLYLPSVQREGIGKLVLVVDTSGSIGDQELALFAGEITAIADQAQPESIVVVYCDAAVQSFQEFAPGDVIQLEPNGGGGTDFRPAFEWVEQQEVQPACLIYLTDLCCDSYPAEPQYPTLWVTDSRRTAAFGETIRITLD